jgi:hypothetical protein
VINQNITTFAQPVAFQQQNLSLSDQEFKRQLASNPQKLANYAERKAQIQISVFSGLSMQESKTFYNNLSPNIKSQVEQSALNNFNDLEQGVTGNTTGFQNDLREIGLIG